MFPRRAWQGGHCGNFPEKHCLGKAFSCQVLPGLRSSMRAVLARATSSQRKPTSQSHCAQGARRRAGPVCWCRPTWVGLSCAEVPEGVSPHNFSSSFPLSLSLPAVPPASVLKTVQVKALSQSLPPTNTVYSRVQGLLRAEGCSVTWFGSWIHKSMHMQKSIPLYS